MATMITYIPTYTNVPMALRSAPDQVTEVPPTIIANYIANLSNLEYHNDQTLVPSYRKFSPTTEENNRINRVINTSDSYTFLTGNGLSYSFYLCNHHTHGLIVIYQGTDNIGWYKVSINDLM